MGGRYGEVVLPQSHKQHRPGRRPFRSGWKGCVGAILPNSVVAGKKKEINSIVNAKRPLVSISHGVPALAVPI